MDEKTDDTSLNGMRDEYDFSVGERGKYAQRFSEGSNVVVLEPDVAEVFKDSRSVNQALRKAAASKKGT